MAKNLFCVEIFMMSLQFAAQYIIIFKVKKLVPILLLHLHACMHARCKAGRFFFINLLLLQKVDEIIERIWRWMDTYRRDRKLHHILRFTFHKINLNYSIKIFSFLFFFFSVKLLNACICMFVWRERERERNALYFFSFSFLFQK